MTTSVIIQTARRLSGAVFLTLILCLPQICSAELLDRIVAIVNDDVITLSELEAEGEDFYKQLKESAPIDQYEQQLQQVREQVLTKLINQKLVSQEATKARVQLTDAEFDQAFNTNLEKMGMSYEDFAERLKKSGHSIEQYRDDLRAKLLRDKLVLYEVRSKIVITEEMVTEYYENEYSGEIADGGYYLLQMGFTWEDDDGNATPRTKGEALQRAREARQKVIDGGDFSALARQISELPSAADGGDLGVFQEDEMAQYMREAVSPLKAGEISKIIETPIGYQFFKLLSVQKGDIVQQVPFDSVKEEIRLKLFEKKFTAEYQKWVENIKEGAYIQRMLQ